MKLFRLPKGTLHNLAYLIRLEWSIDKKILIWDLFYGFTEALSPLAAIVFPKLILDALLQEGTVSCAVTFDRWLCCSFLCFSAFAVFYPAFSGRIRTRVGILA